MTTNAPSPSATRPSTPASTGSGSRKGLSKGAIVGMAIAPSSDGAAAAPPDRHEMENSSNPNAVPDLIPSIVQSGDPR
ncbi:hypothetical protein B9Z19DRAFT_1120792 [Tuber borchii]|uniref:Uncharacterized protein n=1 Tax=Tuber borchii TaxID=42251 RepID=A0A2T7A416_TUBBO|nr:hypothetical protein B9Z19DRAFT_1120792 [Tuber borchii]